jgi:hypothetical protein
MEKGSLGSKYTDRTNPLDKVFNTTFDVLGSIGEGRLTN